MLLDRCPDIWELAFLYPGTKVPFYTLSQKVKGSTIGGWVTLNQLVEESVARLS